MTNAASYPFADATPGLRRGILQDFFFTQGGAGNQWTIIDGQRYATWWDIRTTQWSKGDEVVFEVKGTKFLPNQAEPIAQACNIVPAGAYAQQWLRKCNYELTPRGLMTEALDRSDYDQDTKTALEERYQKHAGDWIIWDPNADDEAFMLIGDDLQAMAKESWLFLDADAP